MRIESLAGPLTKGYVALDLFDPDQVTDAYVGWLNDPAVMRYTEARFATHTLESARAYVVASNAGDTSRLFRILHGGTHVGNLRVSAIDWAHRRAEIAIIVGARAVHGRGIGSTAIGLAAHWCFTALAVRKVCAGMYADNAASIGAFEKAGFVREARLRDHVLCDGTPMDVVLMACFPGGQAEAGR